MAATQNPADIAPEKTAPILDQIAAVQLRLAMWWISGSRRWRALVGHAHLFDERGPRCFGISCQVEIVLLHLTISHSGSTSDFSQSTSCSVSTPDCAQANCFITKATTWTSPANRCTSGESRSLASNQRAIASGKIR